MTGFVLGLCFGCGVALLWFGTGSDISIPRVDGGRLRRLLSEAELPVGAGVFAAAVFGSGLVCALLASVVAVPILTIAAACGGGYAPVAWLRSRRERRRRERERAWPAALSQLADGLEAGLAFPATVALAAENGPAALRADFTAFLARLRSGGLATALDGLTRAGERTADTVVLMLRAGLLELPAGGLAPVLRELSGVLSERLEAREKARSRAASLSVEAAILALSPIGLLLLVGSASPGYLDAYRTTGGTIVAGLGALVIFGCYRLMRRLGRVPEPRQTAGAGTR